MEALDLFPVHWRDLWNGAAADTDVGAVYTKPEIVDVILDLAGYSPLDRDLTKLRLLEPSCGDGAFIQAIVARVLASARHHRARIDWRSKGLERAITAVDLNPRAVSATREAVAGMLVAAGAPIARASDLAERWVNEADFLLETIPHRFDFVVGNPPYVRLEELPKQVLAAYRQKYSTLTDRADLYVGFFEKGLELLSERGVLAYICANRFAKNQYGAALRRLISDKFHVRHYVNLEHTQPFVSDVSAYPAIITIDRDAGKATMAGTLTDVMPETLAAIGLQARSLSDVGAPLSRFANWYPKGAPWSSTSSSESLLLARFQRSHPTLQDSGGLTKIGIGVATGADAVFVLSSHSDSIESDRQLPLAMSRDVSPQRITWGGNFLVNPFASVDDGSLVDLAAYPGLAGHLEQNGLQLRARHVARTRPVNWFRTIDRIWPALVQTPKLLIPDIQRGGVVGFDEGTLYPHHNLYWITSDAWDLCALMALLRSTHVLTQVRAHSVQMRGGSVRYQAQTLRRVHIPALSLLSSRTIEMLHAVARSADQGAIDAAASEAFGFAAMHATAA